MSKKNEIEELKAHVLSALPKALKELETNNGIAQAIAYYIYLMLLHKDENDHLWVLLKDSDNKTKATVVSLIISSVGFMSDLVRISLMTDTEFMGLDDVKEFRDFANNFQDEEFRSSLFSEIFNTEEGDDFADFLTKNQ